MEHVRNTQGSEGRLLVRFLIPWKCTAGKVQQNKGADSNLEISY